MFVDPTGLILGFGVWLGGTVLVYGLSRRMMSEPSPHGLPHPKVPQLVAIAWTAMASLLLMIVGLFVSWYYEFITHTRS